MVVIKSHQRENASRKTYSSRTTLYNEEGRDRLVRIMPGVFVEADAPMSDLNVMQWLTLRQPHSIMNLISALSFHQATTQIPQYLSVALPRGIRLPKVLVMPVKAWFVTPSLLLDGHEVHQGDYGSFNVTTLERTLVDCFKYRHKIGLDIFIEALELTRGKWNAWKLQKEADRLRVLSSITPYLKMAQ